ncbi:MAG: hypothetical protein ACOVNY_11360 [Chitinophagaceae bacterium]|jgi:hypothetical protein
MLRFSYILLFAFSLYTPTALRWFAYAQCIVSISNINEADWCSCKISGLNTSNTNDTPNNATVVSIQIEDKYVSAKTNIHISLPPVKNVVVALMQNKLMGSNFSNGVFRPPCS